MHIEGKSNNMIRTPFESFWVFRIQLIETKYHVRNQYILKYMILIREYIYIK